MLHVHTIVMDNTQRNAYDAAFTLKAINFAVQEGNVTAAHTFGINGVTAVFSNQRFKIIFLWTIKLSCFIMATCSL